MNEFKGHKKSEDNSFYVVRGNIIYFNDISTIVPEYHNSGRSLYMKVIKNSGGKTIIKLQNKAEYNYIIDIINKITNSNIQSI